MGMRNSYFLSKVMQIPRGNEIKVENVQLFGVNLIRTNQIESRDVNNIQSFDKQI